MHMIQREGALSILLVPAIGAGLVFSLVGTGEPPLISRLGTNFSRIILTTSYSDQKGEYVIINPAR